MSQTSAAALRLDPHPREVPALLRFRLRFEPLLPGAVVLFLVVALCIYGILITDLTNHRDDREIARGRVIAVEEVIKGKNRSTAGYIVTARYEGGTVTSHFRGTAWEPSVGQEVVIDGDGDPSHVVIAGGRLRSGEIALPLLVLPVAFGLYCCAFLLQLIRAQRQLHLLRYGKEGTAKWVGEKPQRKGPPALVYEFFDGHRTRELVNRDPGAHDQGKTEPILFDHASGVFLDSLPGQLRAEGGRFVAIAPASRVGGAAAIGVIPVLAAAVAAALWSAGIRSEAELAWFLTPLHW